MLPLIAGDAGNYSLLLSEINIKFKNRENWTQI